MVTPTVTIDGTEVNDISDVTYGTTKGGDIGSATIEVGNTTTNRALAKPASEVKIIEDGSTVWSGEVTSNPSNASRSNLTLSIEAETKAGQLEYAKIRRPLIEKTSSEMIQDAVDFEADPQLRNDLVSTGENPANWSGTFDVIRLVDSETTPPEQGTNSIYAQLNSGTDDDRYIELDSIPSSATVGRRLEQIEARLIVNNSGSPFKPRIIFVDDDGIQYTFDIPALQGGAFETHEFAVEDADIKHDADYPTGTFRIKADLTGELKTDRAFAIDYIEITTFRVTERGLDLTTDIGPTEGKGTRRPKASVLEFAKTLSNEDGATLTVTPDDVLTYTTTDTTFASADINETEDDDISGFSVDRDYGVKNRVTIQGKGDLQASFEDPSSVQFYNESVAKEEPINDDSIRTREQARKRARGFLRENAWEDGAISATVVPGRFADVTPGELMSIDWPTESISGTFIVTSVSREPNGLLTLNFSGTVSI